MYYEIPRLVLGYHGCDYKVFEKVVYSNEHLRKSENSYDWLGHGIYFWENSYKRAIQWAEARKERDCKFTPAVVGAVINLKNCLDLTDCKHNQTLRQGYDILQTYCKENKCPMPENHDLRDNPDVLLRDLDCKVIETIHDYHSEKNLPAFDSTRGVFLEGNSVFPNSALRDKTHIQICIRDLSCILGYFIPIEYSQTYQ